MQRVHVAGIGMTRFGKEAATPLKKLVGDAVADALRDANVKASRVQVAYFGAAITGSITGQEMIPGQVCLRPQGIVGVPIVNVENACASASTAFHLAWQAVRTEQVDVALAVGAEKMTGVAKEVALEAVGRAIDVEAVDREVSDNQDVLRSSALDMYAELAKELMDTWGANQEDFAAIAAKNHTMGAGNPRAQYGAKIGTEEVLTSREIIWPLTLLMCSPISDGAAAAVLVSSKVARNINRRCPLVRASVLMSGASGVQEEHRSKAGKIAAERAFEEAGVEPEELNCVELHDAAAPAELEAYHTLGLGASGEDCIRLVRDRETFLGGRMPVNTSGGLLARGHPVGATGIAQICEAVWQLRDEAGPRQVDDAKLILTHNTGGWLEGDNAAVALHIFSR